MQSAKFFKTQRRNGVTKLRMQRSATHCTRRTRRPHGAAYPLLSSIHEEASDRRLAFVDSRYCTVPLCPVHDFVLRTAQRRQFLVQGLE